MFLYFDLNLVLFLLSVVSLCAVGMLMWTGNTSIDQLQCSSSKVRLQIESRYNMRCQRYHWRIWMWQPQLIMCLNKKTMEVPKSQFCEMSTTCVVLLVLELFASQIWMIGFSNHVKQLFSDDWWHIIHVSKQTSQEATHWGDALPRKWLKPNKSRCRTRQKSVLSCFTKGKGIGQHKLNNWAVSRIIWFRATA